MEELLSMVGNVSFPILICVYVLTRMEKKMDELTKAITTLCIKLDNNK